VFTLRLGLTLIVAAIAAALVAPFVAPVLAWAGFHFPFPRIFDRVVMVALAVAMWLQAGKLHLIGRLRVGFANPRSGLGAAVGGLAAGAVGMAALWALAWLASGLGSGGGWLPLLVAVVSNAHAALAIAIIEEGFFRAFLLDGMAEDFGRRAGLLASSAVYAIAHLIRSPARFTVATFQPLVGFCTLVASLSQLGHPGQAAPGLFGLFLLGLLLGTAFIKTGRVYFSFGLHASLVMGAKAWRKLAPAGLPMWLSGYGVPPLISGAAAWGITLVLLVMVRLVWRGNRAGHDDPPAA